MWRSWRDVPWVADLPTVEERKAWRAALDGILARDPEIVVSGHAIAAWPTDVSSEKYTRDYLAAFDAEAAKASDAKALIVARKKLYPNDAIPISLELGAKVAKGEMAWDE
ncbi:hypothetical protein [Rhizobium sp. NXC24]|uniref:hypothetical protein n=1 Tax=Rhizobium sp. NXC24 TaxID=2048897 RepID=UPI000CDF3A5C|nr:hypothetical protein [Rhizobium sp. NXC24]AVA25676.1 hypothetical protein NXC24_PC01235 [Rhizobium sp. NXC24]